MNRQQNHLNLQSLDEQLVLNPLLSQLRLEQLDANGLLPGQQLQATVRQFIILLLTISNAVAS